MGKRDKGRGAARAGGCSGADDGAGWESGSTHSAASTTTGMAPCFSPIHETQDGFLEAVDSLMEKRPSTRQRALAVLVGLLKEGVRQEEVQLNQTTLISQCQASIKRGGSAEALLAIQLMSLTFLTLPEPQERQFLEVQGELLQAATGPGKGVEVQVAAAECLALCCFAACEDEACCLDTMAGVRRLWGSGSPKVVVAGLRAWTLLATRLRARLPPTDVEALLSQLAALLHAWDVEVRGAAGEALAVLCHSAAARGVLQRLREEELEEEEGWKEEEEQGGGAAMECEVGAVEGGEACESEEERWMQSEGGRDSKKVSQASGASRVMARVRCMASSTHAVDALRRSRRDKAAMRGTFRGVLSALEGGAASTPPNKIKLRYGDVVVVEGLAAGVLLAAVKRCLGGGFQAHLQGSPVLHDWFGFVPSQGPPARLSQLEKRHLRSPSSWEAKARSAERKGQRDNKASRLAFGCGMDE